MLGRQIPGTVREAQTGQLLNCTPLEFSFPNNDSDKEQPATTSKPDISDDSHSPLQIQ